MPLLLLLVKIHLASLVAAAALAAASSFWRFESLVWAIIMAGLSGERAKRLEIVSV